MPFTKINFDDSDISRFQDNVERAIAPLQAVPMVGGNVLTDVVLTSGQDNLIRHGLDHVPQYFIVVKIQANSNIWSPNTATLSNANASRIYLNLRCSTTCTVSVWVN